MSKQIDRTPTLEECLTLWKQKEKLLSENDLLEQEQIGLRASVDYLRHAEHALRVKIATLCYDMSEILTIAGTLADTEQTDIWHNLPKP